MVTCLKPNNVLQFCLLRCRLNFSLAWEMINVVRKFLKNAGHVRI